LLHWSENPETVFRPEADFSYIFCAEKSVENSEIKLSLKCGGK
jgi:hypothetical protein